MHFLQFTPDKNMPLSYFNKTHTMHKFAVQTVYFWPLIHPKYRHDMFWNNGNLIVCSVVLKSIKFASVCPKGRYCLWPIMAGWETEGCLFELITQTQVKCKVSQGKWIDWIIVLHVHAFSCWKNICLQSIATKIHSSNNSSSPLNFKRHALHTINYIMIMYRQIDRNKT